jgi:hypothetical protein
LEQCAKSRFDVYLPLRQDAALWLSHVGDHRLSQFLVVLSVWRDGQPQQPGTVQQPDGENLAVAAPGPDRRGRRLCRTASASPGPLGAAASVPRRTATPAARAQPGSAHRLPACSTPSAHSDQTSPHRQAERGLATGPAVWPHEHNVALADSPPCDDS